MSTSLAAVPSVGSGNWTNLTGGVSITNATSATTTVSSAVPGTFLMIWTENNGNGCVDSDTVSIALSYPPATTFTISPPDCFGDTLIVTYTGNGAPSSTYNWTMTSATVLSGSGDGPYEITYPAGGSYSISLNITQGVCIATPTTVNVTYPNPMVLTVSSTDLTCFGSMNGTVSVAVTDGTQPYTYHWNNGSPASSQTSVPAGNYYITVTDANGCTDNSWTIVGQPTNMFIDVPDSIRICRDSTLIITASATGGTFPYSYQWNSGHVTDAITVSPGATTTYIVTATDANQCTSSTLVSVYVNPPVYLTASSNVDSICPGEKVIITAQASSGTQPYTYLLDGDILYPAYVVYPNTSHTYTITVQDDCQQTASQYVPIYVYPSPPVSMSSNLVSGCDPLTVQFNESSPDSGQTYVWNFGDGESAYIKNPLHIFDEPGIFDVSITVTDKWGCVVSDEIDDWITVFPNPVAQYIAEPPFATIIKPVITFTNYSTLASVVNWYFGDGDSSLVYNPVHTYPGGVAGIYNVTLVVISANGCVDTVMGTIEIQDEFTFYAPTGFSPDNDGHNEMFFVTGSGIDETTFTIQIYDRWGEIIFESDEFNQGWDGTAKDHKLVPVGTYTWYAKFRDFQGILHVKSGPITVVR
jgi:gliding motility-associated-like protein